ncbi:MAG: hypothetical protein K0R69_477 [Clostridia bacterium]|jgi:hypothetical protein|nr:hypothetical protein [Clostridia bacterium]
MMKVDSKQNFLLYIGTCCILAGIIALLAINDLLPKGFLTEYANILVGSVFIMMAIKTKNKTSLVAAAFFFANVAMLFAGKMLAVPSFLSRLVFVPGVMMLVAYISRRKSVILIVGSILTFWGIFLFVKEPIGIDGYHFSIGTLMLFTVLAFLFIWIIERQNWPALPILIFGSMGSYLIAGELGEAAKTILLQVACLLLIIIGIFFVIKSLFKRHLGDE